MKITEAIEKANTKQGVRRKGWGDVSIIPTDTDQCCLIFAEDKLLSGRWNPKKEDLIANDWELA